MPRKSITQSLALITLILFHHFSAQGSPRDMALQSQIRQAIQTAHTPLHPNHFLAAPLSNAYALTQSAIRSTPASALSVCSLLLGPAGWGPALLWSGVAQVTAGVTYLNSLEAAHKAVSRDAGMQELILIAYSVGKTFNGRPPATLVRDFAVAFEKMASSMSNWEPGTAIRYLNLPSNYPTVDSPGIVRLQWELDQLREIIEDPLRFWFNEVQHSLYTLFYSIEHLVGHRLAALKAMLAGRPWAALDLQFIGDHHALDYLESMDQQLGVPPLGATGRRVFRH